MRASRREYVAMGAAVVPYLAVLLLVGPAAPSWLREGVLGNLASLTWVVVLLRRARRLPEERSATLPLVAALVSFMVGTNLVAVETLIGGAVSSPSPSDIAYLLFYPFCLAGLLAGMRAHLRGLRLVVAVDGLTGALAGAAVATCAISPLIVSRLGRVAGLDGQPGLPRRGRAPGGGRAGRAGAGRRAPGARLPDLGRGDDGLRCRRHRLRLPAGLRRLRGRHPARQPVAGRSDADGGGHHRPARRHPAPAPGTRVDGGRRAVRGGGRGGAGGRAAARPEPGPEHAGPDRRGHGRAPAGAGLPSAARAGRRTPAGDDRRAHRCGEPTGAVRRAGPRADPGPARGRRRRGRHAVRAGAGRPRPLQGGQRLVRPRGRRRPAAGGGGPVHPRAGSRRRSLPARAARRRRVRGPAAGDHLAERGDGLRHRAAGEPARAGRAGRGGAARAGQHRDRAGPRPRRQPRRHPVRRRRRDVRREDHRRAGELLLADRRGRPPQASRGGRGPLRRARAR